MYFFNKGGTLLSVPYLNQGISAAFNCGRDQNDAITSFQVFVNNIKDLRHPGGVGHAAASEFENLHHG